MKSLGHFGGFLLGVAAFLTFLYGPGFFGAKSPLPIPKQDTTEEVRELRQKLDKARRDAATAGQARDATETALQKSRDEAGTLKPQLDRARADLNDKDQRIRELEAKLKDSPPGTGPSVPALPAPPQPQRMIRLEGADALRIGVARVERAGARVSLVLTLENVAPGELRVDIKNFRLLDDLGAEWRFKEVTGFVGSSSATLPPQGRLTSRFTFTSAEDSRGTTFDLVGDLILRYRNNVNQQSVAFNGVRSQ